MDAQEDMKVCDWYEAEEKRRCGRSAAFQWGNRLICAAHAAGWLRQGKYMIRLVDRNPYPGNDWLWGMTTWPA